MVSLGAVAVNQVGEEYEIGARFYVEIRPTSERVDLGAMAVNGLDIDDLRANGLDMADALERLTQWANEQTLEGTIPVFVGHNAPFDWSFVNYAYASCAMPNPFGYKALDTKALAMGVLGVHWLDANKELLEVELGLPQPVADQVHRADYDAWYQALILVGLLKRMPAIAGR